MLFASSLNHQPNLITKSLLYILSLPGLEQRVLILVNKFALDELGGNGNYISTI